MNKVARARQVLVKLVTAIGVLVAAASVTFFTQLLVPGDRATAILNQQQGRAQRWSAAQLAPVNKEFGFNRPLIVQYLDYVGGLFRGNLGNSYTQYKPVTQVIGAELLPSLVLTVCGLIAAWVLKPDPPYARNRHSVAAVRLMGVRQDRALVG